LFLTPLLLLMAHFLLLTSASFRFRFVAPPLLLTEPHFFLLLMSAPVFHHLLPPIIMIVRRLSSLDFPKPGQLIFVGLLPLAVLELFYRLQHYAH
jgi:hypothetical protein